MKIDLEKVESIKFADLMSEESESSEHDKEGNTKRLNCECIESIRTNPYAILDLAQVQEGS